MDREKRVLTWAKGVLRAALFLAASAPAFAAGLEFSLTPEGAALLREWGGVGYLYWGDYRGC